MPLTLVLGPRGSGKTYFIVELSKSVLNRLIYSNFRIDHINYRHLRLVDLLDLPEHIWLIMDEFYSIADARSSMSYVNVLCTYIAFQLRKTDTQIFITAQQLRSIDVRYRNEWDYVVICERVPNDNEDWRFWDFGFQIFDKRTGTSNKQIIYYKYAKKNFHLFDTNEIIQPRNKSRISYEFFKSEPKLLYRQGLIYINKIMSNSKLKTKESVKLALVKNGIDMVWANICYLILKN
ncbi:hypothetical protein ES702_06947 [subsurface metagenome]